MTMMDAFGTSTPTSITVVDTRMRELACGERRHDAVLVLACEPAMHQADFVAEALAKRGVALLGRGHIQHLRLGDQRADPIDLRALGDGALERSITSLEPLERHGAGRRSACRPGGFSSSRDTSMSP